MNPVQYIRNCADYDGPSPDVHDRDSCTVIVAVGTTINDRGEEVEYMTHSHNDSSIDPLTRLNPDAPHIDER